MTIRDPSASEIDAAEGLTTWLVLAAVVAYWWFMLRAIRSLGSSIVDFSRWLQDWREEDRR